MNTRHVLLQLGYTSRRRLAGIARFARDHGWNITLEDRSALPRGWSGDGILTILRARQPQTLAYARRMVKAGVPLVDFMICHPEFRVPRVIGDHAAIGAIVAEHFMERRFRHVAWFSMDWTHVQALRLGGFARRWEGERCMEWVWRRTVAARRFDDWLGLMRWLRGNLVHAPKPLGIFAFNDADAARILNAALAIGASVPEEIAIIGVDDESIIVENQPVQLSSVRHDLERLGYEGAALLERLMNGEAPPRKPILVPPLGVAVRRSTDVIAVDSPIMRRALLAMSTHLASSYGTDQLAQDLGVSRSSLNRIFAAELDTSPSAEMQRQRLARAKLLLASTQMPIKAVAAACGFCHMAHLSNVFRRMVGCTPSHYRARPQEP